MATNAEETVFIDTLADQVQELAKEAKTNKKKRVSIPNKRWLRVTIGGVSGILLGAGGAFAADKIIDNQSEEAAEDGMMTMENGLKVAEVDDSQSFQEAFDTARSKVGAGGAFHWHGSTYSTYKDEEWDNMSEDEHEQFTEQVTEVKEIELDFEHNHVAEEGVVVADDDDVYTEPSDNVLHNIDDNSDVQIVGSTVVELEDGSVVTVGEAIANDHDVYLVDLDNDSVYDHAIDDINDDGVISDAESYGIQDDNLVADAGITEADNVIL